MPMFGITSRKRSRRVTTPGKRGARTKRRRLAKEDRRRQLLDTAERLFAQYGLHATTTRDLARAAGVSEAVIFQHFPSKVALFVAVIEEQIVQVWRDELFDALEERRRAGDDEGFVRLLYTHYIKEFGRYPDYSRLWLFAALEEHTSTKPVRESGVKRLPIVLHDFIIAGQQAGRFGPASVGFMTRMLLALPMYFTLQQQLFKTPWQACDESEMLEAGVRFALAGLRSAGRSDAIEPSFEGVALLTAR